MLASCAGTSRVDRIFLMKPACAIRWAIRVALSISLLLCFSGTARAYPWMIRHGYTGCTPCHADPSGSGPLTEYGRAQGELLLRTRYGNTSEEAGRVAGFMWGEMKPPEELRLTGDFREAYLIS